MPNRRLGDAAMILWETDDGREATAQLLQAIGEVVPRQRDRAILLVRIGDLIKAQHAASYSLGVVEQLITIVEEKP